MPACATVIQFNSDHKKVVDFYFLKFQSRGLIYKTIIHDSLKNYLSSIFLEKDTPNKCRSRLTISFSSRLEEPKF